VPNLGTIANGELDREELEDQEEVNFAAVAATGLSTPIEEGHGEGVELRRLKDVPTVAVQTMARSDSAMTFQSYDCSSSRSSTLSSQTSAPAVTADTRMSFCNPHYVDEEEEKPAEQIRREKSSYLLERDESSHEFAAALNSPADSLLADANEFGAKLCKDLVEMGPTTSSKRAVVRPKSFVGLETEGASDYPSLPGVVRVRKGVEDSTDGGGSHKQAKPAKPARPVSAEVSSLRSSRLQHEQKQQQQQHQQQQQLTLLMYVVGGRESGQSTVFRRPISVWRLDLTKTF